MDQFSAQIVKILKSLRNDGEYDEIVRKTHKITKKRWAISLLKTHLFFSLRLF